MSKEITQTIELLASQCGISFGKEELREIVKIENKIHHIREEKVRRLKEQIAAGKYGLPFDEISSAMIRDHVEFDLIKSISKDTMDIEFCISKLLQTIPPGKEHWGIFHKLGSISVCNVFSEELTSPLVEARGSKGSKRFDLMLYNGAKSGFWADMRTSHKTTHVVFEFKNWTKNNHIEFAGQMGRYCEKNRAVVLVTREEPDENIFHECSDLFRNCKSFLPLPVSDKKIYLASELKKKGGSPSSVFKESYLRLRAA